jgi:hypothetical protein
MTRAFCRDILSWPTSLYTLDSCHYAPHRPRHSPRLPWRRWKLVDAPTRSVARVSLLSPQDWPRRERRGACFQPLSSLHAYVSLLNLTHLFYISWSISCFAPSQPHTDSPPASPPLGDLLCLPRARAGRFRGRRPPSRDYNRRSSAVRCGHQKTQQRTARTHRPNPLKFRLHPCPPCPKMSAMCPPAAREGLRRGLDAAELATIGERSGREALRAPFRAKRLASLHAPSERAASAAGTEGEVL